MQRVGTRAALGYILPITLAVLVLSFAGIVSVRAWNPGRGTYQVGFLLVGIAAALLSQSVNYRALLVLSPVLYALSLLPVLYTVAGKYAPLPLVREINNTHAWMVFGPVSFQPAELTKICLVLLLAWMLRGDVRERSLKVLIQVLMVVGLAAGLILQQPDLGTVMTMAPPTLVMLYVAGVKKRHLAAIMIMALVASPVLWFAGKCTVDPNCDVCPNIVLLNRLPQLVNHYQHGRVYALFSDKPSVQRYRYQQERALEAMGSGGLLGKGAGNIVVGRFVPEAHTDMVLALVGEQFGLVGIGVLLMSYMVLFGTGVAIAQEQREETGRLLATGLVTLMAGQAALNMAVAMRLMPVTGVTLPFVSYGGSSLMASCVAAGLLVNIARNQKRLLL